ncbi:AaceriAFR665Cp [[Ashbya] aceris (nom. inval.)]|nr:AaceriAFR665Cp [[Ashbya] aceris (nom. inval.)]
MLRGSTYQPRQCIRAWIAIRQQSQLASRSCTDVPGRLRPPVLPRETRASPNVEVKEFALLEQGIRKTDQALSEYSNYRYKFKRLPANYGSNQLLKVGHEIDTELRGIMGHFQAPIRYAFGYGSGVFEQAGAHKADGRPQMDLIFGVTHPEHFHSLNMRQNAHHYSTMRYFGSDAISKLQEVGAGVYFNPFVDINGHQVKYGVVSMENLLKDLATWDTFYLAGRLQKPVKVLKNDLRVQFWNQLNLKSAATLAKHMILAKSPGKIDEFEFYKQVTALSYIGDVRYKLGGENPSKVTNIVEKNYENFQRYYEPIYKDVIVNDYGYLPRGFTLENAVKKLEDKISWNSTVQTVKGVVTAGVAKSIKYAWAKKLKAIRSK